MALLPGDLPSRFPVGTRYVVEGRGGGRGPLRIRLRYLEFSRRQTYRIAGRSGASRAHASPPRRPAGQGSKIILPRGNSRRHPSVVLTAPGGVPPSPQPLTHPATDPGSIGAGVFFCGLSSNGQ